MAASRHGGEGGDEDVVERGAVGNLLLEGCGARAQVVVAERLEFLFQGVDLGNPRLIAADLPVIGGAEQLAGDGADHREAPNLSPSASIMASRPDLRSGTPEKRHFSG